MPGIYRHTLVEARLHFEVFECLLEILRCDGRELGTINALHFGALWNVPLADIKDFETDVFTLFVAVKPKHHEVHVF